MTVNHGRAPGRLASVDVADETLDILVFRLDDSRGGLPVRQVVGLLRMVATVALPGAPRFIEGLMNYHGEIVPVFDIRSRLGAKPAPARPSQSLVVARREGRSCAFRVDSVEGLRRLSVAAIQDASRLSPTPGSITGAVALEDGLLLIHDVERFLSASERDEMEQFLASVPGGEV